MLSKRVAKVFEYVALGIAGVGLMLMNVTRVLSYEFVICYILLAIYFHMEGGE